jgi:hypothetical protein
LKDINFGDIPVLSGLDRINQARLIPNFEKVNALRNPLEKGIKKGLETFPKSPNPLKDLVARDRFELPLLSYGIDILNLNKKTAPFIVRLFMLRLTAKIKPSSICYLKGDELHSPS